MHTNVNKKNHSRRAFLGELAGTAAMLGVGSMVAPFAATAAGSPVISNAGDPDDWFNGVKGKHKIVFDSTEPNDIFPFAWPKVFLMTNAATGTPEKDCSAVVILRHFSAPFALNDAMWAKYKFGDTLKVNDPQTKAPALRNPFWNPKPNDYVVPGLGPVQIGIGDLQAEGVMFCCCSVALQVIAGMIAQKTNQDPVAVKNEFMANILPNVQPMPSGVWAVGRAQEHGCAYCACS